ncbi:hypothetical protein FLACHUCJ7_03853 [Flavobacterium chungangense]|uniref:Uncharacterized protein n=3 Tax=Flavobacterium TaxID=237 RepID=A0A6V6ZAP7_9FLAO|nr:hypothetical protein FLACHUCJ7_03853 [Flavobacterium chungangense]
MILETELLPYIVRALLFHITSNMRYIFITKNTDHNYTLNVIFEKDPSENEIQLLIEITGELDGDLYFQNTNYNYFVSQQGILNDIWKSKEHFYLVYARNED